MTNVYRCENRTICEGHCNRGEIRNENIVYPDYYDIWCSQITGGVKFNRVEESVNMEIDYVNYIYDGFNPREIIANAFPGSS